MYVLVAIVKKRLNICTDLYTILQILSLTLLLTPHLSLVRWRIDIIDCTNLELLTSKLLIK